MFIFAFTIGAALNAAPPVNDNLAKAQVLAGDFGALIADTTEATLEEAEKDVYYSNSDRTMWYKWTSSAKEKMPFHFAAKSLSNGGCEIEVYTNVNASAVASYDNLVRVGYGWEFCAEPGKTYLICLRAYSYSYYNSCMDVVASPGKVALRWWRDLADGEWKILAADGIVLDALGDLPQDLTAADFPAGVTEIAKYAFEDFDGVKFVTIPATVTKIGNRAFADSSNLAWVDYEGDTNAIEVADSAFLGTPYSRELPFKLILDEGVYTNCYYNAEDVFVTNVNEYCAVEGFVGTCPAELVIPEGVTEVYWGTFSGAETLVKVKFPSTLEYLEEGAFIGCSALAEVTGIPQTADVDRGAFYGSLYEKVRPFELITEDYEYEGTTNKWVVGFHGTCPEEVTIPEGIYGIESGVFSLSEDYFDEYEYEDEDDYYYSGTRLSLANLKKVTLAASVKEIYDDAFSCLPNLAEVVFGNPSVAVEEYAFIGTPYFATQPDRPFRLFADYWVDDGYWQGLYDENGDWTNEVWVAQPRFCAEVYGYVGTCPEKLDLTLPSTFYTYNPSAYVDAASIPSSVAEVYVYEDAFAGASTLTELVLPSAGYVEDNAFVNCEKLAKVTILDDKGEMEIDDRAFVGTPYFAAQPFRLLADYWVDDGYWQALYDENGFWTNSVWVAYDQPKHCLEVYGYVGTCPAKLDLTQYTTNSVDEVYVYEDAFAGANTLKELVLPGVGSVDEYAFAKCENLAKVTILNDKGEMEIDDWAFVGTPYYAAQPFRLLAYYGTREGERQPLYDENGWETNSVWVAFDHPKKYVEVYGYVGTCPAKLDLKQYITNSVDIVCLEEDVFSGLDALTELILPEAEYDESYEAFRDCANLSTVTVKGSRATDKGWLTSNFRGTPWLDKAVPFELVTKDIKHVYTEFPKTKEAVGTCNVCVPCGEPTITNVVTNITKTVIGYYGNVPATLTFPADVTEIDDYLFAGCGNITEVIVPGNVKYVGSQVFAYCDNLQNVEFQEGVEWIGDELFYGCGDGMQVILPASVVVGYYDADEWLGGDFDYACVFSGIVGDVSVVAPRTTRVYDRAFYFYDEDEYDEEYRFGRTCVEYYTHVVLDANGGTFDGETAYRCFDDVLTGLPTPSLAGNVFRGWWDDDDTLYENGYVWGENDAQVYLTAEWAREKKCTVYGLAGGTEIALGEGDDYETLLRVLEDMFGGEPQPSRHGLTFRYWTVDGEELNHRSEIGPNSKFDAFFDEFNPLTDNPEAAVDTTAAQTYDGFILDFKGNNAGTIQVKVGKPNKNTGEAKISATLQMFGEKKVAFKAEPKGSWKLETGAATKGVTLFSAKATDKIVIDISEKGIFGTYGNYEIIGSRNTSKKDAAYANWIGKNYDVALKTKEGTGSAFTGGYSGVTVSIASKGKVKISGVMADGAKVNASAQLLISDKGEGCVNVFVPMYSGKKGGFGFVLWINSDYTTASVESISVWKSTDNKSSFTAELELVGVATPAPASEMAFTLEAVPTISGATVLTEFLPTSVKAAFSGIRITVAKANNIKVDKAGVPTRTGTTDNDAALKLNYMAKDGSFKGSFTVYTLVNSKLKKVKADVNGVFVGGVGYGTAVIKGVGSFPVSIR